MKPSNASLALRAAALVAGVLALAAAASAVAQFAAGEASAEPPGVIEQQCGSISGAPEIMRGERPRVAQQDGPDAAEQLDRDISRIIAWLAAGCPEGAGFGFIELVPVPTGD